MQPFWNNNLYPDNAPLGIESTRQFNENSSTELEIVSLSHFCRHSLHRICIYSCGPPVSVWSTSTIPGNVVVSAVAVATIEIAMQKYAEIMLQRFVAILCAPFERTRDLFVGPFFMFLFLCQCFLNAMHWKCMLLGFVGPSWRILCSLGRVYLSFCFILLFVFKNKSRWPYCVPTGWNKDMVGERNASICIKMGNHCKLGFIDEMHLAEKILLIIWLFQVFLLSDCNFTKSLNIWQLWKNNIWRLG